MARPFTGEEICQIIGRKLSLNELLPLCISLREENLLSSEEITDFVFANFGRPRLSQAAVKRALAPLVGPKRKATEWAKKQRQKGIEAAKKAGKYKGRIKRKSPD